MSAPGSEANANANASANLAAASKSAAGSEQGSRGIRVFLPVIDSDTTAGDKPQQQQQHQQQQGEVVWDEHSGVVVRVAGEGEAEGCRERLAGMWTQQCVAEE